MGDSWNANFYTVFVPMPRISALYPVAYTTDIDRIHGYRSMSPGKTRALTITPGPLHLEVRQLNEFHIMQIRSFDFAFMRKCSVPDSSIRPSRES